MKLIIVEGNVEEIIQYQRTLGDSGAMHAPASLSQDMRAANGATYPSVEAGRRFLKRRPLSDDQKTFFRTLAKAHPNKVLADDLRKAMKHDNRNALTGVLGALGRRFSNTPGVKDNDEFFCWEYDERGTRYGLPESVREALKLEGIA